MPTEQRKDPWIAVSAVVVLLGTPLALIGKANDRVGLSYASIALSLVAAAILYVRTRGRDADE